MFCPRKNYSELKKRLLFSPAKLSLYTPVPHISKAACAGSDQLRGQMSAFVMSKNSVYSTNTHMTVLHCECEKPQRTMRLESFVRFIVTFQTHQFAMSIAQRKKNNEKKQTNDLADMQLFVPEQVCWLFILKPDPNTDENLLTTIIIVSVSAITDGSMHHCL